LDMQRPRQRRIGGRGLEDRNSSPKNDPSFVEDPHHLDLSSELPPSALLVPCSSDALARPPTGPLCASTRGFVPSRLARPFRARREREKPSLDAHDDRS